MDGPGLSGRELRILAEIEDGLRADGRLDRALRTMRRGPRPAPGGVLRAAARVPPAAFAVLLALSAGLLVVSADAHTPAVLAVFALVWAPTAFLLLARLTTRRRGSSGGPGRR
ncbi:hypothetical protein [Kitasatospora sp. SUK 42]|uniref:hypothetical protein n=1 Tax=Kitasatospora sp. SUK 42 TaxID=1588882 RepID=UPI0018CA97A7|nr:hypothetical protein [Kitasatospora sp. SUK 42]MBV2155385.1 hypothetical protein [Kitasatospora sp. SUK 42]